VNSAFAYPSPTLSDFPRLFPSPMLLSKQAKQAENSLMAFKDWVIKKRVSPLFVLRSTHDGILSLGGVVKSGWISMHSALLLLGEYTKPIIFSTRGECLTPTSVLIILLTVGDPPFTPITRATSLLSLESAIFSVLFSRIYYFRFTNMPVPQIAFCLVSGELPLLLMRRGTHNFANLYLG